MRTGKWGNRKMGKSGAKATVILALASVVGAWMLLSGLMTADRAGPILLICVNGQDSGRTFEGIGAVSAGASSRLLIDYPEPQRSQILDYLFKPNYGASLQHLKVEVGGDTNSTDGSEPSHMRTRAEENYQRGYEWWLMKEAKARNPKILLDVLPWGAPGWIGNGRFYSEDMAEYIVKFIQGAKKAHGLDIDYVGIWNETAYDTGYIKLLKKTLQANGLPTKVVAADLYENQWSLTDAFRWDPELKEAVHALTAHYPRVKGNVYVTGGALGSGKPLWSSEDQPSDESGVILQRDWVPGGRIWAQVLNTNYVDGKLTKTEIWSPVTSYYDILAAPNSGLMYANTPWSGHYDVQAAIWVTAHTSQFAQPGWQYLDGACGHLPGKGSYVSLKSPTSGDYSIIVETIGAAELQEAMFQISGGLSTGGLRVWRSNAKDMFIRLDDITPKDSAFMITLEPESIYSLTTTTGQRKGEAVPPPPKPFPIPYAENFDSAGLGRSPKYFADQNGTFEVTRCLARTGQCLEQVIDKAPIAWGISPDPLTLLGSVDWRDYEVSAEVLIEQRGSATLIGRIDSSDWFQDGKARWSSGYVLTVQDDGSWQLNSSNYKVATAKLDSGKAPFSLNTWHRLVLRFKGTSIEAFIDAAKVASVSDATHKAGMAGVGSGWNKVQFDDFKLSLAD